MSASESSQENEEQKSFFCHSCSSSFLKQPNADYICPSCNMGFIEELPENTNQQPAEDEAPFIRVLNDMNQFLGPLITGSLAGGSLNYDGSTTSSGSGNAGAGGRRQRRQGGPISFEDILQEILVSITDGANSGRTPMFFNPADYAWGQQGLDTIVTQLLNQMDNAGPPPLEKEKIDEIPKCEITQEQVNSKLQCSVCWEDFQLKETVRQLPCSHVYHEDCILPWLNLHGTCPVCRKSLVSEEDSNSSNASSNNPLRFSLSGQASTSQQSNASGVESTNNNISSNSNESTSENNTGGSSSRRLRDDVEFDFD
ncbi:hypothetical protein PVAND_006007 [Polypedilum vanderplanki]|uniref:RING-type E3 ubiquitin transferase n=1 Tax=Polypedilum vanderplanki TaxID=319348 RepID=A0A9J6C3P3_POLVA|nr:hypothetical protein PVAND_006007 [Polypedilum vanderplanki]